MYLGSRQGDGLPLTVVCADLVTGGRKSSSHRAREYLDLPAIRERAIPGVFPGRVSLCHSGGTCIWWTVPPGSIQRQSPWRSFRSRGIRVRVIVLPCGFAVFVCE